MIFKENQKKKINLKIKLHNERKLMILFFHIDINYRNYLTKIRKKNNSLQILNKLVNMFLYENNLVRDFKFSIYFLRIFSYSTHIENQLQ